jgi:hypothetical protein
MFDTAVHSLSKGHWLKQLSEINTKKGTELTAGAEGTAEETVEAWEPAGTLGTCYFFS